MSTDQLQLLGSATHCELLLILRCLDRAVRRHPCYRERADLRSANGCIDAREIVVSKAAEVDYVFRESDRDEIEKWSARKSKAFCRSPTSRSPLPLARPFRSQVIVSFRLLPLLLALLRLQRSDSAKLGLRQRWPLRVTVRWNRRCLLIQACPRPSRVVQYPQ